MEISAHTYNSDLLKGTGLIQETLQLIDFYEQGLTKQEFIRHVLEMNTLGKEHENRTKDIIHHVFYNRYLSQGEDVILDLQLLRKRYVSLAIITQILLIYTCKANYILFDFIAHVYQRSLKSGDLKLPQKAAHQFIQDAITDGKITLSWADSTKRKVSEHINACLIDFKLTDRSKTILPFIIDEYTVNYWLHKLHFKGTPDESLTVAEEWNLFGLDENEVIEIMHRISYTGHFMLQHSGEIIRISWKYKSMEEFIYGSTY